MRGPSRQTTARLTAGALRLRRHGAREIGDDKAFGALGDIGEGQRAAGRQQIGRRFGAGASCVVIHGAKRLDAVEQRAGIFGRERLVAGQRGIEVGIGHLDQAVRARSSSASAGRRSRRRRNGRGSGPSRACRDASSETAAACGGHRARRSIVSFPSLSIPSERQKPGRAGRGRYSHRDGRCQPLSAHMKKTWILA